MRNVFICLLSVFTLISCTTSYLTDDDDYLIGYGDREQDGEYKDAGRKQVTVKEPLIQSIDEPAPDLVAMPVEKVAVEDLSVRDMAETKNDAVDQKKESAVAEKSVRNEVLPAKTETEFSTAAADGVKTVDDTASTADGKDSLTMEKAVSDVESGADGKDGTLKNEAAALPTPDKDIAALVAVLPEENEKIEQNPPEAPDIKAKNVRVSSVETENIDGNANILTLVQMIKFRNNSSRLGELDNKRIENVADVQKKENKLVKIIVYAPYGYEKTVKNIYAARRDNALNAIVNKYGVKKDMVVSEIEVTNVKEMFNRVEFYIAY